jgi:hypothetical protein
MRKPRRGQLFVRAISRAATRGVLVVAGQTLPCALGRTGCRALKREGDGATPSGIYRLESVMYRPDRYPRPRTGLPLQIMSPADGWCDAATDRNYNRRIRHPYPASAEKMWRTDSHSRPWQRHLYACRPARFCSDGRLHRSTPARPSARAVVSAVWRAHSHSMKFNDAKKRPGALARSRSRQEHV